MSAKQQPADPTVDIEKPEPTTNRLSVFARIVQLIGWISLLGSIGSYLALTFWVADILAQLTVQFVIFLLVWLCLLIRQCRWKTLGVVVIVTCLNLIPIVPYFVPATQPKVIGNSKVLRIATLNVLRTNSKFQTTFDLVLAEEPDLIYLSEVQPAWTGFLEDVSDLFPYQLRDMSLDYTGVVLLSRLPLENVETLSIGRVPNPTYDVKVIVDGKPLRIIATHPLPPLGGDLSETRDQQLLTLAERLDGESAELMMGDLNQSPWSPKFRQILAEGNLRDASRGYGITPTLAPLPTWLGGVKVDHFMVNPKVAVVDYYLKAIPDSDHRLIVLDCQLSAQ